MSNLESMRAFYLAYPPNRISKTSSRKLSVGNMKARKSETPSRISIWTHEGEDLPVGLILCAQRDAAVAHYVLDGLPNEVMAAEYRTALPEEKEFAAEIERTRAVLEERLESYSEGEDS